MSTRLLLLVVLVSGCARARPAYPAAAASSPDAKPGAVADVTRSLRDEPPLPGDDASGWAGLRAPSPATPTDAPAEQHQHHHHHQH